MPGHLLYSTNSLIKKLIQESYFNNKHYVWCSETFSRKMHGSLSLQSFAAASSDPCSIFEELQRDCKSNDRHSAKIRDTKSSLIRLSVKWHEDGLITESQGKEIAYMVEQGPLDLWRPLLYVIPKHLVQDRIQEVVPSQRATFLMEYVIPDLDVGEFDIMEW